MSCCASCESQPKDHSFPIKKLAFLLFLSLVVIFAVLIEFQYLSILNSKQLTFFCFIFYLIAGYDVLRYAIEGVLRRNFFNENFLMTIATLGAFIIGQYPEALGVMVFYRWGDFFQGLAVDNSQKSIENLLRLRPDTITLFKNGQWTPSSPPEAKVGMLFRLQAGERAGVDGEIVKGEATLDTSALTGESRPFFAKPNDKILAGMIVESGLIEVEVSHEAKDSSLERILAITLNAMEHKSRPERFISRFARVYTPIIVLIGLVVALVPPLLFGQNFTDWLFRALTILVISCPCALMVSVPLGYFAGIGVASKNGIIFKGSSFIDQLRMAKTVVLDKTGTLTTGKFEVEKISPASDTPLAELKELALAAEQFSNHPLALSIRTFLADQSIDIADISQYQELKGQGVKLLYKNHELLAGQASFLEAHHYDIGQKLTMLGSHCYIGYNGIFKGVLVVNDALKADSFISIPQFHAQKIATIMLTGDNKGTAASVAQELALEEYYAELLPEEKLNKLSSIIENASAPVVFVGDGINDAPSIARADIGFAMGQGSDSALEVADAIILNNNMLSVNRAFSLAHSIHYKIMQNIVFVLATKFIVLILGILGLASMWLAVFADTGVLILTILNSYSLLLKHKNPLNS